MLSSLAAFQAQLVSIGKKRKAFKVFSIPSLVISRKLKVTSALYKAGNLFNFWNEFPVQWPASDYLACQLPGSLVLSFLSSDSSSALSPVSLRILLLSHTQGLWGQAVCLCLYLTTGPQELRRNEKYQPIFRGALCWLLAMQHQN